ncbi:ribonuclease T2-like isoform X4 [Varanus komodoensis]|nr:ribonuclease T2-like isoform X4 [Varanus komodoensis]
MAANWAAWAFLGMGVFWLTVSPEERRPEAGGSRTCPWECLIFVQLWPGSFCVALGRQFECVVPKNAHNWTIHGLWPDHVTECCAFWRLFPSDLAGLESELSLQWPTFINTSSFSFWEKEWQKHGTCAGCIETLHTPQNYFQAALFLHSKYNIDRAFQTAAVVPSCSRNYQVRLLSAQIAGFLSSPRDWGEVQDEAGQRELGLHRRFHSSPPIGLHDFCAGSFHAGLPSLRRPERKGSKPSPALWSPSWEISMSCSV